MYRIFWRTWWKENPLWPKGLEPAPGKWHYLRGHECNTEDEARAVCREFNSLPMSCKEERLGKKYEFTS